MVEINENCIWNNFTNKYSLSKTLRFELKPIGKTLNFIKEKGLIEEDKKRAKDFLRVKEIMDDYYKEFIDNVLSEIELDVSDLKKYFEIYSSLKKEKYDEKLKKELKSIQDKIRKNIFAKIKNIKLYNKIFKKEFIKEVLPEWLKNNNYSQESLDLVKSFDKWNTYFTGFFKNRENVFSEKPIPTSIIYRSINDNLPKFFDNIDKFEQIKKLDGFNYESIENKLKDDLNNHKLEYFFTLENYNLFLNQKGIDLFNLIIGGKTDGEKIQGLNELINLYSQKIENKDKSRNIRKLKMIPLFKQILSDKESFSDKFESFKDNDEVVKSISDYYNNIFLKYVEKLKELILNINNYDLKQIYVKNDISLTNISKQMFGDWNQINQGLEEYGKNNLHLNKKQLNSFLKQKYISIYDLEESIKLLNLDENKTFCNYLFNFCKKDLSLDDNVVKNKLLSDIVDKYNAFTEIKYNKLNKFSEKNIELIKSFLDSIMDLIHFVKPLYINLSQKEDDKGQDAYEIDSDFYNKFHEFYKDNLCDIISLYNKTRNFISKKPYSIKKFKLNFENSTLLDGWDKNKETDNFSVIFKRDNSYYLGIMTPDDKNIFKNLSELEKNSNNYQKLEYKLISLPSRDLIHVFFSEKRIDYYNPSEEILNIKNYSTHTKNGTVKSPFYKKEFNLEDCHKFIDFLKESLNKHPEWKNFNFIFKDTNEYNDISEFYKDVSNQGYSLKFINISEQYIDQLVNEGKLYLFEIYNKDFSKYSKGKPNLHTIYWNNLFSPDNLKNVVYKLNGEAEIFFREKSLERKITHEKNKPIDNKNPINNKKKSTFEIDLIKNKRFTEDKFLFHCPITINFKADGSEKNIHKQINKFINSTKEDVYVLGIDRGERHLLYYTLLNPNGDIIEQGSLNNISEDYIKREKPNFYHDKLNLSEEQRAKARKNWTTIENIKELKEGYLSQVIHKIALMIVKYNAIVVLEDLNYGFKKGRFKIEKQVYQKFEKMLIDKLNYLVFKDIDENKIGGSLKGYQLVNKFESFKKLGKQSGVLYYVPASFTSKIDPKTGFVNLLWPKFVNLKKSIEFFSKFNYIKYNKTEDLFEFNFNYSKFLDKQKVKFEKDKWSIWSNGIKLVNFRNKEKNNEWDTKEVNVNEELKDLFLKYSINFENENNLVDLFKELNENDEKKLDVDFFKNLIYYLKLILQLRNSRINDSEDYLLSCVKDKNGNFFDSRNAFKIEPKDADANGAYHIGLKGLMVIDMIKKSTEDDLSNKIDLKIERNEFINYVVKRNK